MKKRVADIIMDTLADNGVEQAFCVVGGGAMYLNNALGVSNRIKTIFNHHEQACAMAAEGYVRYTGDKPALVCVTSGPGGTNALTGVMGAYEDSIPMIVISGQVRYETTVKQCGLNLRRRGEQEFDIVDSVHNMTKYVKMITDPLEVKKEVQKAYDIAMSGRRGPVWLDIPLNVQNTLLEEDDLLPVSSKPKMVKCTIKDFEEMIDILKKAKSPCVLAGSAIASSNLREKFEKFLENIEIPVVSAAVVSNSLYHEHSLYFGSTGGVGTRCGNFVLQNADVILNLGCSLGFKQTGFNQEDFAPSAKIVMIDVNPDEAKKPGLRIYKTIVSDVEYIFDNVLERQIKIKSPAEWLKYCNVLKKKFDIFEGAIGHPNEKVNSYNVWKEYTLSMDDDGVTVMGNSSCVTPGLSIECFKKNQKIFTNINCGSMGYGFPAALGAAIAAKKPVTLFEGDGSFMMNLQELQTMVYNDIPVKMLLFSNDGYQAIVSTHKNYFNGFSVGCSRDCGLSMPDFSKVIQAFGIPYMKCETNADIEKSLKWLKKQKSYAVVEIRQIYGNPVIPVVKSRLTDEGVSLSPKPYDMFPFLQPDELKSCMYSIKE